MCGGWAIDLFLDEVTREHEDLEVGVFRDDQASLAAHLAAWGLFKCATPGSWDAWQPGERLVLPVHQVLARPPGSGPPPEPWEPLLRDELQFFLHDVEDGSWVSRRHPLVRRPSAQVCLASASGIPIVVPEIQLLYKAKHHLEKDEHDFRLTVPRLGNDRREWLREALALAHPRDAWLERLD